MPFLTPSHFRNLNVVSTFLQRVDKDVNMKSVAPEINFEQRPRCWKRRYKSVRIGSQEQTSLAVISCLVTGLFGALISTPSNIAVLKGQEVALNCSTNSSQELLWYVLLPGTTSEELIFDGQDTNTKVCFCSVQQANHKSTLYLPANESTATRYTCTEMSNDASAIAAQVIVLESDPICGENSTEDSVNLTCSVTFSGHWSPVVEWMEIINKEDKEVTDVVENKRELHGRKITIVSTLSIPANKSATEYKCTVKFSSADKPWETTAENVPAYSFSWPWKKEGWNETVTKPGEPGDDLPNTNVSAGTLICIVVCIVAIIVAIPVAILAIRAYKSRQPSNLEAQSQVPLQEKVHGCRHNHKVYATKKKMPFSHSCFMMMLLFQVVQPALVKFPLNTVIQQHGLFKAVDLPCKSNDSQSVKWFVLKNHDSKRKRLHNGVHLSEDAKSYCTVKSGGRGEIDISLQNTASAAQTYICWEPGSLDEVSADVIWIESDPICNDSSSEDLFNMTCRIEFRGNWAPTMEWRQHGIEVKSVLIDGVNTIAYPNHHVTSTLVIPMRDGINNFTCTTRFDISGKPKNTTAGNVPNYSSVWTSEAKSQDKKTPISPIVIGAIIAIVIAITGTIIAVLWYRKRCSRKKAERCTTDSSE